MLDNYPDVLSFRQVMEITHVWKKSTASSSEQRRNSRLQDGKTLEGLQTRPDPVYEPLSVSRILRLGQKESRWTPQQESSGI